MRKKPVIPKEHRAQKKCVGCPFGGPKVGSKGDPKSPIVFVAESPGLEEVNQGAPLVGPSGRIFHTFVPEDGSIYVLNAMECKPPKKIKDEKTLSVAASCCHDRLIEKIQEHPRRLIVAMGNPAVRSLTGNYGLKITQIRGRLLESDLATLGIMPVVHVAALMRGTGSYRQWRQDIEYALELGNGASPREYLKAKATVVARDATRVKIEKAINAIRRGSKELTCDLETSSLDYRHGRILTIGITNHKNPGKSWCFFPEHLKALKPLFEDPSIKWCWHGGKFDIKWLRKKGIKAKVNDDTMLMSYTLDESTGGVHDLETVAADVLDAPDYKWMVKPYLPNKDSSYELIPEPVLCDYMAIDVGNTAQIRPIYRERIRRDPKLEKLYTRTILPASELLAQVENNGFYVDQERLAANDKYYQDKIADVGTKITDILGYSINPNSYKQVGDVLFRDLRFPDKAKGSTAEPVINKLMKRRPHPFLKALLEYRGVSKAHGTYVKGIIKRLDPNGRIYCDFWIHGTRTGRLSSRNPNMQNIPRDARLRGTFIASPGYILLEVDLSQAELRSLTALSGDPILMAIYNEGGDLHADLANYLFPGWDERNANPKTHAEAYEQRVKCKNVNFGIMYGITEFGLMDQINSNPDRKPITLREAREMIRGWYARYEVAAEFIAMCRSAPTSNMDINTHFGRRKRVGLVSRDNINFLKNEAANFPHQSIASDITLHAAIRSQSRLKRMGVKIVNLVHDSVVMEVPQNYTKIQRAARIVSEEMRQVPIDWGIKKVPFVADAEVGDRWGSLEELVLAEAA